ncbi:hypothetical protein C8R43DRAFT_1122154 [Mycena crocata]|nr:hypothetical protein C8R43DRAFT_1122154 [Mycena crocata]
MSSSCPGFSFSSRAVCGPSRSTFLLVALVLGRVFWPLATSPRIVSCTAFSLSHKSAAAAAACPHFCAYSKLISTFSVYSSVTPPLFPMASSSSESSVDSGRSFFDHPRPAPPPPSVASQSSRSTPEGFVLPVIPPINDPLVVTYDTGGHRVLPHVSDTPLAVDDGRVTRLVEHHPMITPKCANCAELCVPCQFSEAGVPCPPCSVLGIPDCDWANPFWFIENLQRCRDLYLLDERTSLVKSVKDNRLPPSLFEREFERAQNWFYSGAQGAISRFLINTRATRDVAVRGYQSLAAASTDPSVLLRFLALGVDTRVHPAVLGVVAERLQGLFQAMLT